MFFAMPGLAQSTSACFRRLREGEPIMKTEILSLAAAAFLVASALPGTAAESVTFGTNWLAQAEHGGYYQAVADGTYAKYGLDVTIAQGGPQAPMRPQLVAGQV